MTAPLTEGFSFDSLRINGLGSVAYTILSLLETMLISGSYITTSGVNYVTGSDAGYELGPNISIIGLD